MAEITGWLLDLYEDGERGLALWLITEDDRRICLHQAFPVRFYAAGSAQRLRKLWRWLRARPTPPQLARESRRDLFLPDRSMNCSMRLTNTFQRLRMADRLFR